MVDRRSDQVDRRQRRESLAIPLTIEFVPSLASSRTCVSFATPCCATMIVERVSSKNDVIGIEIPLVVGRSIVPVTGTPACKTSPGLSTIAFTVKFVEPGATCPSTATILPLYVRPV